jgi:hypothetical protein
MSRYVCMYAMRMYECMYACMHAYSRRGRLLCARQDATAIDVALLSCLASPTPHPPAHSCPPTLSLQSQHANTELLYASGRGSVFPRDMMRGRGSRPSALALAALCASAAALAVVVMGRGRSVELCAGGCMTHGIPGESRSPPPARCQRASCRVAIVLTQPTPLALTDRAAVPMRGPEQAIHHSRSKMLAQQAVAEGEKKARVQQLDAYSYDDWSNTVQIGDKDHEWKKYVPEESVMGKPYVDVPFAKTVNSVPIANTAR